ncbi:MAG: hypothetical protein J6B77_09415 [Clostridia bacterium]|nr:hypothetical protein [Clostridia bacterium]
MGKGNRNRKMSQQREAEDRYNHPERYQKKGKRANGGIRSKSGSQFPAWAGILAFVLVAVIVAGSISLAVINDKGVVLRAKTAMESEHYEVTGTMMKYFYYVQYQQTYSTYYNYAVNYLGNADYISYFGWTLNANFDHMDEYNNKCTLGEVKKDEDGKELKDEKGNKIYDSRAMELRGGSVHTWWDYFMDMALDQAEEILVFCEAAYAAGYTTLDSLNPDAKDEIEDVIDSLRDTARTAGYSLASYISQLYGKGVTVKDVRRGLELSYIASEYAELKGEEIGDKISEDEVNTRYEDNALDYQFADVLMFDYSVDFDDILESWVVDLDEEYTSEEYAEVLKKAENEYVVRLEHMKGISSKFADAANNEELFRDLAMEIFAYDYYFQCYIESSDKDIPIETAIADAMKLVKESDKKIESTSKDPLAKRIASFVYDAMETLTYDNMKYQKGDAGDWAFKAVGQKNGNVLLLITDTEGNESVVMYPETLEIPKDEDEEDKKEDEESTDKKEEEDKKEEDDKKEDDKKEEEKSEYAGQFYDLTGYYMVEPAERDEYHALELGVILIPVTNHNHKEGEEVDHEHVDPKFQAEDYLAQFKKAGDLTMDGFEKFVFDQQISDYYLYENYLRGDFYEEIDEWALGDTDRVGTGDVVAVYAENSEPSYYAMVYCFGEGDLAWYAAVKNDIQEERYEKWSDEISETYGKSIATTISTLKKIG